MDFSTFAGILGTLATAAAATFGVLKWIGGYRADLVIAQNIAAAAKVGAEGALSLLTEIIAVSDKNSMTKADVDQIVATASDIPGALRIALKIGSAAPEVTATVATRITAAV